MKTQASSWVEQLFSGIRLLDMPDIPPRYNIAPTQPILALFRNDADPVSTFRANMFRWGLVPSWADDLAIGNRMINARSETLSEKPSFRKAFVERRCVVVADGYYEWQKRNDKTKRPFWIHRKSESPFLMAGLWEINHKISKEAPILSVTIITTPANATTSSVHDRMPAIVEGENANHWLDPTERKLESLQPLLQPASEDFFELTEVGTLVNNPRHESEACLAPVFHTPDLF